MVSLADSITNIDLIYSSLEIGFSGFVTSVKESFLGLLGDFDLDTYVDSRFAFISVSLLIIYIIVVTILLLNLLVAMMGDTYGKIIDDATKVW